MDECKPLTGDGDQQSPVMKNQRQESDNHHKREEMERSLARKHEAGAHTRPLLCSTSAVLVSEPCFVQFVTSHDPSIQ